MGARRRNKATNAARGRRGLRGKTGPAGPPGPDESGMVARLAAQMDEVIKELQTQLLRIGQIQLQLDRLAAGASPEVPVRQKRTDN